MCNFCKNAREEYKNLKKNSAYNDGPCCVTRWAHESFKVMQKYETVTSKIYGKNTKNKNGSGIKITFTDKNKYNYRFFLSYKYPFHEPIFFINNLPYKKWLQPSSYLLNTGFDIPCFCCESMINSWTGTHKILDLIDEFNLFKKHTLNYYRMYWIKKALEKKYINYEFKPLLKKIFKFVGVYKCKDPEFIRWNY